MAILMDPMANPKAPRARSYPKAPAKKRPVGPVRRDFQVQVDEETGAVCITSTGYKFDKSIILSLDEMPERYQAYFAKYILCK